MRDLLQQKLLRWTTRPSMVKYASRPDLRSAAWRRQVMMFPTLSSSRRIRLTLCRDRADNRAAKRLAVGLAIMKQVGERVLNASQVRNASPRLAQPSSGNATDAATISAVLKLKQSRDLLQAEAQSLATLDETDAVYVSGLIAAVCARPAAGLGYQSTPLVITHCLDPNARGFSDIPDGHADVLHKYPLTPYRSTDFTLLP